MRIGVNNIFTTIVFLLLILFGGFLFYSAFTSDIFEGMPIAMYPFLVIIGLVCVGIYITVFLKFRIVIVDNGGITCFYPFLIRKKQLAWENLEATEWTTFYWKGIFRKVELKGTDVKLSLTDLEFENFNALTEKIPDGKKLRKEIDKFQAESEKSMVTWYIYLFLGGGIFLLYQIIITNNFWSFEVLLLIDILLLYVSFTRRIRYVKALKKQEIK